MRSRDFTLIVILIVVCHNLIVYGEKMDKEGLKLFAKPMRKSCIRKTGVDPQLVDNVRDKGEFPQDPKLMCFYRCISMLLKVMNKKYEITFETCKTQVDLLVREDVAKRLLAVTKLCTETVPVTEDTCFNAFELVRCAYQADPWTYFIP